MKLSGRPWVLLYDYVPDLLERRDPYRSGHLELLAEHQVSGRLLLAGALGDPPRGGLLVFSDEAAAWAFVDADPYVEHGLVTQRRIEPWTLL